MRHSSRQGFIALMAVIVIGVILLGIAVEQSVSGWYARFNVLSAEDKEQALALAEGCADIAFSKFVSDTRFDTTEIFSYSYEEGSCSVIFDTSIEGIVTLQSEGVVRNSYATVELSMNTGDLALGGDIETPEEGTLFVSLIVTEGAVLEEFTMSVNGGTPETFTGTSARAVSIHGGGFYDVSVTGPAGYDEVFIGDCDTSGQGELAIGMTESCVVILEPTKTSVTFLVNVINDDGGGLLPSDFLPQIDDEEREEGVPIFLSPGAYDVDEVSSSEAYTVSSWSGACDDNGLFTLSLGEKAVCEITYNDVSGGAFCLNTTPVAPVSSTGGNGWANPLGVLLSGGSIASSNAGATGDYFGFPITGIPPSATIRGITVYADAYASSLNCALGMALSWDGGSTWTNEKTRTLGTSLSPYTFGGTSAWTGHVFTSGEVTDQSLFRVKMHDVDTGTSCIDTTTVFVDSLSASISYGSPSCVVTAGTPTPIDKGTLIIETRVVNDNGGALTPGDFSFSVAGETFGGVGSPGEMVAVSPGAYEVITEGHNRYRLTVGAHCLSSESGNIQEGEIRHCVLIYDDVVVTSLSESLDITIGSWRETAE